MIDCLASRRGKLSCEINMAVSERKHWKHLYEEIVATEICCGCSACIVACPHKVLELGLGPRPDRSQLALRQLHSRRGGLLAVRHGVPAAGARTQHHRGGRFTANAATPGPARGRLSLQDPGPGHRPADPRAGPGRGSGHRAAGMGPRHTSSSMVRSWLRRPTTLPWLDEPKLIRTRGAAGHRRLALHLLRNAARPEESHRGEVQERRARGGLVRIDRRPPAERRGDQTVGRGR